jgi:hypothetical protein
MVEKSFVIWMQNVDGSETNHRCDTARDVLKFLDTHDHEGSQIGLRLQVNGAEDVYPFLQDLAGDEEEMEKNAPPVPPEPLATREQAVNVMDLLGKLFGEEPRPPCDDPNCPACTRRRQKAEAERAQMN